MREEVIKKYPQLANKMFKLQYKDKDLNRFIDVEEDDLPPPGSEINIEILGKVLARETVVDESETQFNGIVEDSDIIFEGKKIDHQWHL